MWTGQVNVGFPWLLVPTVTRHHLGRKQRSVLLLLLLLLQLETCLNSDCTQRAGKWKNTSRYSPILLKLSDKVLLNFFILPIFSAGWEDGIRSHILGFFPHRLSQRTGSGQAVVWSGEGGPVFSQPCGGFFSPAAARWQTGNGASTALTSLIN